MTRKKFLDHQPTLVRRREVNTSPGRGRGVFAREDIEAGSIIEYCPALVFDVEHWTNVEQGPFGPYIFSWKKRGALALGITSMLNHSDTPNAEVAMDYEGGAMELTALEFIPKGTEISLDYGPDYNATWLNR
jgi:SET domain-containing protein